MNWLFYISAIVAIISTVMVITRTKPVHAILYLVVSFFAVALMFFSFGAPFAAALEIIIYAGAIIVLFVFIIMLLSPGSEAGEQERSGIKREEWFFPGVMIGILLIQLLIALLMSPNNPGAGLEIGPKAVSAALFGPYLLGVELASILLLGGLVGAYHLCRRNSNQGDEQ